MVDLKVIAFLVTKLLKNRRLLLQKRLRDRHLNFLAACERIQRRHQAVLQILENDFLFSIAAVVKNQPRKRSLRAHIRSDRCWALIKEPHNEQLYFESLRMTKATFQSLCTLIEPHLPKQKLHLTIPVPTEKQIAICLYKLASAAEYRVIGDVFGVHKSTVHKYFHIVINAILELTKDFIQLPDLEEYSEIVKGFEKLSQIPNIIGLIDCKNS